MLGFSVDQAKSQFFDRLTVDQVHDTAQRGLGRFGSYVRRTAKTSLKNARQKKLAELTPKERQIYHIRMRVAKQQGKPVPRRPLAHSRPGEPPRMIMGQIKQFLFFAYDQDSRSVVIGPARLDRPTGAPEVLEEGGFVQKKNGRVKIARRPYMKPAFDENIPLLPRLMMGEK